MIYVHPFAEEMNKARRMAALQARRLAAADYAVLQPDLLGCGDSSGDFGEATWSDWVLDVVEAAHWLNSLHPGPLWFLGLRGGALLCCAAARQLSKAPSLAFWQPATSGRQLLLQFLRVKATSQMLGGGAKGVVEALQQDLANGHPVQVAGYRLHPALASGMQGASLDPPARTNCRVEWLELQSGGAGTLSPAAVHSALAWQQAGAQLRTHVVAGTAFWQTTEIEVAPALLDATCAALQSPQLEAGSHTNAS